MQRKQLERGGGGSSRGGVSALLGRMRSARPGPRVGVQILHSGDVHLAACSPDGDQLLACEHRSCPPEQAGATLAAMVEAHGLRGEPAHIVLDGPDYEIQQVDAPGIPDDELSQALQFQLKDVASVPISDMAVAGQRQYANRRLQPDRLALAMVARRSRVQELVNQVSEAGLEPQAVLGRETVLHDIATHAPGSEHAILMVHLAEGEAVMTFSRAGQFVLARSQEVGLRRLRESGEDAEQVMTRELLRSVDYHDSQLSQQAVSRILLSSAREEADLAGMSDRLSEALGLPVAQLRLQQVMEPAVDGATRLDEATQIRCLLAAGAALPRTAGHDVSLYHPPARELDPLAPAALAGYAAAVAVLLGGVSLVQGQLVGSAEERLAEVEAEQQELLDEVQELEQAVADLEPSAELVERRDELAQTLETQQQFLAELRDIDPQAMSGFSGTLEGLGHEQLEALWLTQMRFSPESGHFQGYALDADEVTRFFSLLGRQSDFQGWRFDHLELDRITGQNGAAAGMRAYRFDAQAQRGGEP